MFFSPPQGGMHVSFHRMPSHQSGFRTASSDHTIPGQKSRKSPLNNRQRKMRAERASFLMTPDSSEQRLTSAFTRLQLHGRSSTTLLPTWDQLQELVSAARDSVLPLRLPVTPSNLLLLCFHCSSPRCFGRVDVDREESRVKQTKPKEACRQTSSPVNILNKVQDNEEEERLNRELELTTKERNELTDRLLYVTGGSMNKSPYFRPNPFYENLKIKEKEVMSLLHNLDTKNIEHREKFQELKKEINFYCNLHSRLLMDQACMKKKLVTLKQESKEVQRYLFELNPNDEDEQEKTSNLQTQQNVVSGTAGDMA